jgi:hypothetical protein
VIGKRENALSKGRNLVEKAHLAEDAKGTRADWAGEGEGGL